MNNRRRFFASVITSSKTRLRGSAPDALKALKGFNSGEWNSDEVHQMFIAKGVAMTKASRNKIAIIR